MDNDPPPCANCGHHRGAHFREGCDADITGPPYCPCKRYVNWAGPGFTRRNSESAGG